MTNKNFVVINGGKLNIIDSHMNRKHLDIGYSKAIKNLRAQWEKIKTDNLSIEGDIFIEDVYQLGKKIQQTINSRGENIINQINASNLNIEQRQFLIKLIDKAYSIGVSEEGYKS